MQVFCEETSVTVMLVKSGLIADNNYNPHEVNVLEHDVIKTEQMLLIYWKSNKNAKDCTHK